MPIKKIQLEGIHPANPIVEVIAGVNENLDAIVEAFNNVNSGVGVVGETGAKGDRGDMGPAGIQGPEGPQGVPGKDGKDGRDGIDGKDGKDGSPGLNGQDGKDGFPGEQGPAGKDGKDGQDGQPGRDGLPGRDGIDGQHGKDGVPGAMGPQGPAGVQGLRGEQGIQGIQGPAGKDGATGPAGPQGVAGPAGAQGLKGDKGDTGAQGPQGVAGPKGDTGAQGPGATQKIILNSVSAGSSRYENVDVALWSASYTSQGGQVVVRADITAWTGSGGVRNWYLKKNGTTVATGLFCFNVANQHMTLPPIQYTDTTGAGTATWSIAVGAGLIVDGSDFATITVVETVGMSNVTITKAAAFVDAGQFVTLDNLKFALSTSAQKGLCCSTVSGTATLAISGYYSMIGGVAGTATNWSSMPTYNSTTVSGSWFGWSFPNAGDTSIYNIQDVNAQRFYRVTLMIGPGYTKNFISIERLY